MVFAPYDTWDRFHIIHCGVTPSQFSQVQQIGEGTRLLFVGRLAAVKGLPMLLESVKRIKQTRPNIKLTVVGDGPDRQMLEAQTADWGLSEQVEFVGYQSQAAVREYLQQTDAFVLPSFAEGVPVVLMEAMMSGVPVVATQIAGVSELVTDGESGFLVPPSNVEILCDRIQTLLADGSLRQRLGTNGATKVRQDFDISKEAEKLARIMAEVTSGGDVFEDTSTDESRLEKSESEKGEPVLSA